MQIVNSSKPVCIQRRPSAVNMVLPAFAAERRVSVSAAAVESGRPVAVCNSTRSFDRLPRSQSVAEPGRGVARECGGCGSTGWQLLGAANG